MPATSRLRKILLIILAVSFGLRIVLIAQGGQYFWPDENRYEEAQMAGSQLLAGNQRGALQTLHTTINPLFSVLSLIPAFIELSLGANLKIPALFFTLFSILNIWLLAQIVRALGGGEREAVFAALLLALSSTFFYYSRHLLPYDTSMAFALSSIFFAIRKPSRLSNTLLSGLLAFGSFFTYTGSWLLVFFSFIANTLFPTELAAKDRQKRALIFGLAFALPLATILLISNMLFENPLLDQLIFFADTITQGDFSEGWRLPFEYFWRAEHLMLLFWGLAFLFSLRAVQRGERNARLVFGLAGIVLIYLGLVFASIVLKKFVVYGRLARQLVPFFVILGAYSLEKMWASRPKTNLAAKFLVFGLVLQAAVNFNPPFTQVFPIEFRESASAITASLKENEYQFLYDKIIYPEPDEMLPNRIYEVRLQSPHPLEFLPYQFEGYTPAQRQLLRTTDISMRLILFRTE